jgi:hypothetical protein
MVVGLTILQPGPRGQPGLVRIVKANVARRPVATPNEGGEVKLADDEA